MLIQCIIPSSFFNLYNSIRLFNDLDDERSRVMIRYIFVNMLQYMIRILWYDIISKKIDMYFMCNTIGLCISRYGKHILQYVIHILRHMIHYNMLTWLKMDFKLIQRIF